jgi:hypothetical protein
MKVFPDIRIEGGLLGPDVLDQVLTGDAPGQKPANFGVDGRRSLTDEIAAVFADARSLWGVFQRRLERVPESDLGTSVTRDAWVVPFLSLLDYKLQYNARAFEVDGLTFAISHRAGEAEDAPPVHIVGARQELGRLAPSGRPRLAPHSLVQEYLNRTEFLWGIVTNGLTLRLLRNSTYIRKQAYIEFDLATILEEQHFQDFAALYRLLHRSRLPRTMADAEDCLLEKYYRQSRDQGDRVRERLRDGVKACLEGLANGFLQHPANSELRERVSEISGASRLAPVELYRQLLRIVYRFLFLLVSEDRGLISADLIYREHYGIGRLRRLVDSRAAYTRHDDIWQSLRVLWKVLSNEKLAEIFEAAPLNGELFAPLTVDRYTITNRALLEAFWNLAWYQESSSAPPRRVNYAALDVEELGSVYEGLLEYDPEVNTSSGIPRFELAPGSERRETGSYYTPPELVAELIHSALDPVIEERLQAATSHAEKEATILSIRVCDPAAGSGHFLLAAARRLGKELARIRTGEDEPAPERVREAIRDVVAHCIYGVDKNPLAVELCRVALWLEAHAEGKPLAFLDRHIRLGDSLVGIADLEKLHEGIPDEAFKPVSGDHRAIAREAKRQNASERKASLFHGSFTDSLRRLAEPLRKLEDMRQDTLEQVYELAEASRRVERSAEFQRLRLACDAWTAAYFQKFPNDESGPVTTQAMHEALSRGQIPDGRLAGFVLQASHNWRFFHWPLAFPEVFSSGGFDVVIGNPPFMGGMRISGRLGDHYRNWLGGTVAPFIGTADLCAAFYRRVFSMVRPGGCMGMVATNTIGQGDTRESGLAVILRSGGVINFARRFVKWPGTANIEVNLVAIHKSDHAAGGPRHSVLLDGQPVDFISSRLDADPEAELRRLRENAGRSFQGDILQGIGFVLEPAEAGPLLAKDARNADCIFPYLNGEDVNSRPEQSPSRYVICFHDWDLEHAREYPDLLEIVEKRVKPGRMEIRRARNREMWWRFAEYRQGLRRAIAPLRLVLARSRVSELHALVFVPQGSIYSEATVVFAFDDDYHFALLQSNVHEAWVWRQASSLESRNRYTLSDCFDTFPFPQTPSTEAKMCADRLGCQYHEHRRQIMLSRNLGLTKTYNLFHSGACADADIVTMRALHAEMDRTILACYGWHDLDPQHGFYQNDRGQTRFTVSPVARRELLRRLLELNLALAS